MRTDHVLAFVALGLVVLACSSGGPGPLGTHGGDPSLDGGAKGTSNNDDGTTTTSCADGSRFFNGECRAECDPQTRCADPAEHCIEVEEGESPLCLPYSACAYLGDDTQCVAHGGSYVYSRGGMQTFVPYQSTPGADPDLTSGFYDPYFYGGGMAGPCAGDATWMTTEAEPPVGCTQTYMVNRCRLVGSRCAIVRGTTREFVQP